MDLAPGMAYLDHAAMGPWPRRTLEAVEAFGVENMRHGASRWPSVWPAVERGCRERLARLFGARPEDVALTKNTSEAVSIVAAGLPWRAGDNVVLPDNEFPANRAAWQALASSGVEVRTVPAPPGRTAESLIEHMDRRTRLVAMSWVQYDTGEVRAITPVVDRARQLECRVLVDAIQGLGVLPWRYEVDFIVGGSHKWLLAPEGVGYLVSPRAARDALSLQQHGWRNREALFDFGSDNPPTEDARRFEPGTLNTLGMTGLNASIDVLLEEGLDAIEAAVVERLAWLSEVLAKRPDWECVTPKSGRAGILSYRVPDAPGLMRRLREQHVHVAVRGDLFRVSPHFYTPPAALEQFVAALN